MADIDEYRGEHIVVLNDAKRCIHSRYCVLGRPDVFVPNVQGPWIKPDAVPADTVAAQVALCPSGALLFKRNVVVTSVPFHLGLAADALASAPGRREEPIVNIAP